MKKIRIDIPVLLPTITDEKDQCIQRILQSLENKKGIEKVHIKEGDPAKICIHYDPEQRSLNEVKKLAKSSGAKITNRYRHLLLDVTGVRHARHARSVEETLGKTEGVVEVSVSAAGVVRMEWDSEKTTEEKVLKALTKQGLQIKKQESAKEEQPEHDHEHEHGGFLGENTELYFALGSGAFWISGLILSFVNGIPEWLPITLYIISFILGGYFTLIEAIETIRKGKFEIDFLMLVAAGGAAALGKWEEGALLLFLFSLGHALEHYAMNKARKSITALADLAPPTALVKKNGKQVEVPVEDLKLGDVIIVKPNTKIAADGVVIGGSGSVDQSPISGESIPVDKTPVSDPDKNYDLNTLTAEHRVFAGTINGNTVLEVKVLKEAADSTLSRMVTLVKEAETQKSPTQHLTDKFEKIFVPSVLVLVTLLLFAFLVIDEPFKDSFYRAMAVLVAASPCALAISTPSAVLSGVARAARQGILIKGGRPLEDLGTLTALAFDKTGTLTEGKPRLTHVIPFGKITEEELLSTAVAVEKLSDHPLAGAIVKDGLEKLKNKDLPEATNLEAITARGIKARLNGKEIYIGNRLLFEEITGKPIPEAVSEKMEQLESEGHTAMIVGSKTEFSGIISVMDVARKTARKTLQRLKEIGIKRITMLTGDNQKVADAVAKSIGITDAMGELLPEDKVAAIEKLKAEEGKVAMVGDGVNDAPAMARSTVGIAMGAAGSDVALETADIALMADKLDNLPFAIALSRKAKRTIKQNLWISLGVVALLVPATIMGWAKIGAAVAFHEGSTLVVVINALRLLAFKDKK